MGFAIAQKIEIRTLDDLERVCPGTLSPADKTYLEETHHIDLKVAAERGYRTVEDGEVLRTLGFKKYQWSYVPGLLQPIWDFRGHIVTFMWRANKPRLNKKGEPVKWDAIEGSPKVLDIHPRNLQDVKNPSRRLIVNEGPAKGDWFVSRGYCAVSLQGVTTFRGSNQFRGITTLQDWDEIGLNNRSVIIAFDQNIATNPDVHRAAIRFSKMLSRRDARVFFLDWGTMSKNVKEAA